MLDSNNGRMLSQHWLGACASPQEFRKFLAAARTSRRFK